LRCALSRVSIEAEPKIESRPTLDKLVRLLQHPLPRVLFWLAIILIFEALDIPWRLRKLRARLS
jgi:hypothetical protein